MPATATNLNVRVLHGYNVIAQFSEPRYAVKFCSTMLIHLGYYPTLEVYCNGQWVKYDSIQEWVD